MSHNKQTVDEIEEEIMRTERLQPEIKKRINPKTGEIEYWNQPKGLPGIWMPIGFCERCKPYGKCEGYSGIPNEEWDNLLHEIRQLSMEHTVHQFIQTKGYKLQNCLPIPV
jgi:hypothetical protein